MKKTFVRLFYCLIPVRKWRHRFRLWALTPHIRTDKLFESQYDERGYFMAYDTCVRYAFAREYLDNGKNPDGFWYKLYVKMQTKRGKISDHHPEHFMEVIDSYVKNGYNGQKIVLYGAGVILADGSHRMALNLLFGHKNIYYDQANAMCKHRNYGTEWFENNGFTQEEISEIKKVKDEIFKRYKLKKRMD